MKPPPDTITAPPAVEIDAEAVAAELEDRSASDALAWMFDTFGEQHYIACSFQKTSSVTLHLATEINPAARFFYLDTDVLFPETYETRDRLAEHFGIDFHRYHNLTIPEQAEQYGDELWKREPDSCCGLRKVEPMRQALSSVDCWVSGIRRGDSSNRSSAPKFAWDKRFGAVEAEPAGRLVRAGRLEPHPREPHSLQPAARPRLPLDRLHPLHAAGRTRGRPPRRPLGRHREDRVRHQLSAASRPHR